MTDSALFIVEGAKAEPRFLKKLYTCFVGERDAVVVSYGTNVHVLMDAFFSEGELDEDIDLLKLIGEIDPTTDVRVCRKIKFKISPSVRWCNSNHPSIRRE